MIRNLIIALVVAIFTASLTLSEEMADDTDSYGNVPSVESCIPQDKKEANDDHEKSSVSSAFNQFSSHLCLVSRGHKTRSNGGFLIGFRFENTHSLGYPVYRKHSINPFIVHRCSVPHYIFHRNLRI